MAKRIEPASTKVRTQDDTPAKNKDAPKTILQSLGPGLITGAADDDPSGIGTYSQVGAQFGFSMLWTMLFTFPLMAAVQEICGRLGRITGCGIAESLRKNYSAPLAYGLVALLCAANIFNLGADVAAMGSAAQLVAGGNASAYALLLGGLSLFLQIAIPYRKYVHYLKWLTMVLFAYVIAAFVVHVPWIAVAKATVLPSLQWNAPYWMALVAVLGTTISPYLFFWQCSQEAEEVKANKAEFPVKARPAQAFAQFRRIMIDTRVGMAFSNVVAFFIILTTAATLHTAGAKNEIQTAADAANALKPLAGQFTFLLFSLGIVGTGMLAIPVLAGSAAYAVAELFRWKASLESKPRQAPQFYLVLVLATVLGVSLNLVGMNPIRALYWSAVINGVVAVPLMFMLMHVSDNPAVVGKFRLPRYLRILGWISSIVMLLASAAFLASIFYPNK